MHIHPEDDERITLTLLEIRILIALAEAPSTSYDIGRYIQRSTGLSTATSQGSLVPALRRLEQAGLIHGTSVTPPAQRRPYLLYRLTPAGQLTLKWRLQELQKLSAHGQSLLHAHGL